MLRPEWAGSKETNQTKHTPYPIHTIELWGIYCKHFGETWYYNAIALYFGGASVKLTVMVIYFYGGILWFSWNISSQWNIFFPVWPVLVLLHWPGMAVDCDDRKLKTCCRGGTPRTILKQKDPFGAFCCILAILVIKTVLGGKKLMEMSKKNKRENSHTWLTNDMNLGWNKFWSCAF